MSTIRTSRVFTAALAFVALAAVSVSVSWSIASATDRHHASARVPECIQGQLQVAIEQGGGLAGTVPATFGYTFLVVNTGPKSCAVRGYPYEIIFSRSNGTAVKVAISHRPTELYRQPKPTTVIVRPDGVASFGISYRYGIVAQGKEASSCAAELIDVRLPALYSHLFSYEFPVRFDGCAARRQVEVTPLETRSGPVS